MDGPGFVVDSEHRVDEARNRELAERALPRLLAQTLAQLVVGEQAVERRGELGDIATAAVYLLSPSSRYVVGASLAIDGGFIAQ